MEAQIVGPTERPSLLLLNEYCLLVIYDFLDIDDSINLSKTCNRLKFVADRIFKKHSKFRLDSRMMEKGEKYILNVFKQIGQYVTSLVFCCYDSYQILGKISNNCKNLKNLNCSIVTITLDRDVQPVYSFDNVEQLTLSDCWLGLSEDFEKTFFASFHKLKCVIIERSYIGSNSLKRIFQNNPSIESFVFVVDGHNFNCQLLELIPNVERLSLIGNSIFGTHILELDSLLKLNRLTKLRINCLDINTFLRELATNGILEEMHLDQVTGDDDFFDTLMSFSKLQLLVLYGRVWNVKLKSSISWPTKLKKLKLSNFRLIHSDLISIIQQLKCIESFDIGECDVVEDDITNDVTKLSQNIRQIIEHSNRKHRLDVVFPYSMKSADASKKYLFDSERIRVVPCQHNPLGIKIHFAVCDFQ